MRVLILAVIAASAPVAAAQAGPRVVIEDDVSRDNAIKCGALRASQVEALTKVGGASDVLLSNTHKAWLAYLAGQSGYNEVKVKAEIEARANSFKSSPSFHANPAAFLETIEKDCVTFEIRSPN